MKEVIRIDTPKQEDEKPVEFTHCLRHDLGWKTTEAKPHEYQKVVYLGECKYDGDMFAAYYKFGTIVIFKGHLNSGRY